MKNILVVGGAGYIGSHMVASLLECGYHPIILDNLSEGHRSSVLGGTLILGNMEDRSLLQDIFSKYAISAVMHFAAFIAVGESVTNPGKYYHNNVVNTHVLLEEMIRAGVLKFIFSSTCATYGLPIFLPFTESHPQQPVNPYGRTKLMIEYMLEDYERAHGLTSITFRYFNAAGSDPMGRIGEQHNHETHLIPNILRAAKGEIPYISVFGDDYDTPDGTCIRDYIHVLDIADAHIRGLGALDTATTSTQYNLANGHGFSVKEVIAAAEKVTGKTIPLKIEARRPGDPARLVGDSSKIYHDLGWEPRHSTLENILETAWKWEQKKTLVGCA